MDVNGTILNPIQHGEEQKDPPAPRPPLPTSSSPVTSANARISLENFLTFSFDPFVIFCKVSRLT